MTRARTLAAAIAPVVFAAAVPGLSGGPAVAQQPTFSSRLDAVRVDVLVTERNRVALGLGPADFELLDNGVPQTVDLVSFEELPLNVVLVFDLSASVAGERLAQLQVAARAVLGGLKSRDQAALLTFSHRVELSQPLTGDAGVLAAAVEGVVPAGDTALFDGTYAGMMLGSRDPGRDLVIVFSDGVDTLSWLSPAQVIETAKRTDAVVYSVSVRGVGSIPFLRDVTQQTGGSTIEVDSPRELSARFLAILEEFRQRYLVSYSPRGVTSGGWHRLEVRVKGRRGVTVKARPGYLAR
jgi:Ca-activated chloride channel homolog